MYLINVFRMNVTFRKLYRGICCMHFLDNLGSTSKCLLVDLISQNRSQATNLGEGKQKPRGCDFKKLP